MAEIKIQKKKNNNLLPWLFAILGLILLGWLAVDLFDKDGEPELLTADEVNFPDAHLNDDRPDNDALNAKGGQTDMDDDDNDWDENWDGSNATYNDNYEYFMTSIDRIDEDMDVHHEYSSNALRALANSLIVYADENDLKTKSVVKSKCEKIKQNAMEITQDWKSTDHADKIRAAALSAVEVINDIQMKEFPNLKNEVVELEKVAQSIKKGTLALDQKKEVKSFFEAVAKVLDKMTSA